MEYLINGNNTTEVMSKLIFKKLNLIEFLI